MARTRAWGLSNKSKGQAYESGMGYKGVLRRGSKYGWKYEDGKTCQSKGGFDTPEEAAYSYDEFLLHYVGPNADTNQALGFLKLKVVLEIREKLRKTEKPVNKADKRRSGKSIGASGFKGVSKNSKNANGSKPWRAQTTINGKFVMIGTYKTPEEAARAYDLFVLKQLGSDALTNISLGLLPPIGEVSNVVPFVASVPEDDDEPAQPETNDSNIMNTIFSPSQAHDADSERERQIAAARQMGDDPEEEEEAIHARAATSKPAGESNVGFVMDEDAPAVIPTTSQELIPLTDAEKLRQKAQELLRLAAEAEAGDIKRQAETRLNTLSATVSKIQTAMTALIDCCADIETEIQSLRELLK